MAIRRNRAEDLENQLNRGALWAVTYGDLMSYLMIFFLILFSFSIAKKTGVNKYEESLVNIQKAFGGKIDPAKLEKIMAKKREAVASLKLEQLVQQAKLSEMVDIQSTEEKIKLTLQAPVLFDSGKTELKVKGMEILTPMVELLKATPNQIVVEGHTDDTPISPNQRLRGGYQSNFELSMARAYSVIRFFETHGIPSSRLAGAGYGEFRPVVPNDTPAHKARNRRIEISLLRK
jgi:chemotaxis protein MotB